MKTINNNIEEQRVGFDNAKLLKEKEFDVPCNKNFELALKSKKNKKDGYSGSFGWKEGEFNVQEGYNTNSSLNKYYDNINWYGCSAPTQQVVIDWIRINFDIFIRIDKSNYHSYDFKIYKGIESLVFEKIELHRSFNSPEEAKEAAINYVLTNLI